MHVFGKWEEAVVPGEILHMHRENMQNSAICCTIKPGSLCKIFTTKVTYGLMLSSTHRRPSIPQKYTVGWKDGVAQSGIT